MRRSAWPRCLVVALTLLVTGCGTTAQKKGVETALDATNEGQRRGVFEATARALDERPEYVDELYAVVRQHPTTMRRILAHAAHDLKEPELAATTAELLMDEPQSIEAVLVATTDHAQKVAAARQAIAIAVEKRATIMADIVTDRPSALVAMLEATVQRVEAKPKAQQPFLDALQQTMPLALSILRKNPRASAALTRSVVKAYVADKPVLDEVLSKMGLTKE